MRSTILFSSASCTIAALLVGYGTDLGFTQTHSRPPGLDPRPASRVELLTGGPPQRPYTEFGVIEAHQESVLGGDDRNEMLMKLRAYAGFIGCDAVIVGNDLAPSGVWDPTAPRGAAREGYRGTCIVYDAPPPSPSDGARAAAARAAP
jgi:hypothetical protein